MSGSVRQPLRLDDLPVAEAGGEGAVRDRQRQGEAQQAAGDARRRDLDRRRPECRHGLGRDGARRNRPAARAETPPRVASAGFVGHESRLLEPAAGAPCAAADAARHARPLIGRRRLDAAIAERQQQPDDRAVDQQRRAAVADERQRDTGQRHDAQVAAGDDRGLDDDDQRQAGGQQGPEIVGRRRRDAEAALGDQRRTGPSTASAPSMPISSASAAKTKSVWMAGIDGTDADLRQPGAEARAEDAATTVGVQRADDLVAGALRVGERVEPDVDAVLDVREERRTARAAGQEQQQAEHDVRGASRGHVEQRQEDEEVEQRRAQVALDDHDRQGEAPHREHRQQVRQRRQRNGPTRVLALDKQRPVLGQVAGQEDDQDDLQQLRRLAGERARCAASAERRR